jgi:chemotaxis protein MotB
MGFNPLSPPPDDGEGWLVSYADLMTLIACFFILMVSFANFEDPGFQIKAEQLAQSFNKEKYLNSEDKLKYLESELAKHPELKTTRTKVSVKDGELVQIFSGSIIFNEGQYELDATITKTVDSLIDIIKTENTDYRILVEGYADDLPEKNPFKDEWTLSSARASAIARRFEYFGFPKDKIAAVGKADSAKLAESYDKNGLRIEQNAKMNRRAIIKVLEPISKKKIKLGLGVYFEDSVENK